MATRLDQIRQRRQELTEHAAIQRGELTQALQYLTGPTGVATRAFSLLGSLGKGFAAFRRIRTGLLIPASGILFVFLGYRLSRRAGAPASLKTVIAGLFSLWRVYHLSGSRITRYRGIWRLIDTIRKKR